MKAPQPAPAAKRNCIKMKNGSADPHPSDPKKTSVLSGIRAARRAVRFNSA
jgi:hypothetical protein